MRRGIKSIIYFTLIFLFHKRENTFVGIILSSIFRILSSHKKQIRDGYRKGNCFVPNANFSCCIPYFKQLSRTKEMQVHNHVEPVPESNGNSTERQEQQERKNNYHSKYYLNQHIYVIVSII